MSMRLLSLLAIVAACHAQDFDMADKSMARAQSSLVSPLTISQPPISFFWTTVDFPDAAREIPQCSSVIFTTMDNPGSPAMTVPPLYYTIAPVNDGFPPITLLASDTEGANFEWTANLPVNTTFYFAMRDSANSSGGAVSTPYVITSNNRTSACNLATNSTPQITFDVNPGDYACDEISISIQNGVAPYTVNLIAGLSGLFANLTGIQDSTFFLKNNVPAGQTFFFYITDSSGSVSFSSPVMTSALGQPNCNPVANQSSGSSGRPLGAIIGGVVGGIAAAAIIALIAWWAMRKRTQRVEEQYEHDQHVSEYTNLDGTNPTVHPFVIPPRGDGGDYDDSTWDDSSLQKSRGGPQTLPPIVPPTNVYDNPYLQYHPMRNLAQISTDTPLGGQGRGSSPISPVTPLSYHSTTSSGPHGAYGYQAPSSAAISHEPYSTTGSTRTYNDSAPSPASYHPAATSSSAVDGLVDPNEFRPRVGGIYPAPNLPPGARST